MPINLKSAAPQWMKNYGPGWIGFEYKHDNFVSEGIRWFERFDARPKEPPASHTFVVSGENECIEAQSKGVVRADLQQYFNDPHCVVWFRKPSGWDQLMGNQIVKGASWELGKRYAFAIIVADLLANTIVGHAIDRLTGGALLNFFTGLAEDKREDICSMVSAKALDSVPALNGLGVLKLPPREITPASLDADNLIFEPKGSA